MIDNKDKTVEYYDKSAHEWVSAHGGYEEESFWQDELVKFKKLLPNGNILEVGPGAGREASKLIELGYNYTGIEPSIGLLKIAKKRNPTGKFEKLSIEKLEKLNQKFDGFWAAAVFLHIPKNKIDEALQNTRNSLKGQAIGFVTMKNGEGEKEDENGRWFAFYSEEEFKQKLENNGFKVLESYIKGLSDGRKYWLAFFVKAV